MPSISQYAIDKEKRDGGVWTTVLGGIRVKVRSTDSSEYKSALANALRGTTDRHSPEKMDARIAEVVARVVLLDWENITEDNANGGETNVPYARETAVRYLIEYPEFSEEVMRVASNRALFRPNSLSEDELGNSKAPSAGKSRGAAK